MRVAIFEDNKLVRESFEAILNGTDGFSCTGSFSSANNLRLDVDKSRPDIILMDIEMSGMNGIEATKAIKETYPDIKILIQTVFEDDEKIFAAVCAGASGYVLKSNGLTKLLESVSEVYNGGLPMSSSVASRVLKLFQQFAPPIAQSTDLFLSPREKEILSMMVDGKDFRTIAAKNFISYETVRTHVKKIYKKLHVASASEAVAKAIKQRLV